MIFAAMVCIAWLEEKLGKKNAEIFIDCFLITLILLIPIVAFLGMRP